MGSAASKMIDQLSKERRIRRANNEESTSLLPLWIILGIGVVLAVAWFALSSCLGDHTRQAITDRIKSLFSKRSRRADAGNASSYGGYGRMRDDEAEAFDITAAEHDLYDDLEARDSYPPSGGAEAYAASGKYGDLDDDAEDRFQRR